MTKLPTFADCLEIWHVKIKIKLCVFTKRTFKSLNFIKEISISGSSNTVNMDETFCDSWSDPHEVLAKVLQQKSVKTQDDGKKPYPITVVTSLSDCGKHLGMNGWMETFQIQSTLFQSLRNCFSVYEN